jgi:hypothetical protein
MNNRLDRIDGVLVAGCSYESNYSVWALRTVCFEAEFDPTEDRLVSQAPLPLDYTGTHLAGIAIDSRAERCNVEEGWDPFTEAHPLTGSLYFDTFRFIGADLSHREYDESTRAWSAPRQMDREWLRIFHPEALQAIERMRQPEPAIAMRM